MYICLSRRGNICFIQPSLSWRLLNAAVRVRCRWCEAPRRGARDVVEPAGHGCPKLLATLSKPRGRPRLRCLLCGCSALSVAQFVTSFTCGTGSANTDLPSTDGYNYCADNTVCSCGRCCYCSCDVETSEPIKDASAVGVGCRRRLRRDKVLGAAQWSRGNNT
jgi:hypothetical protein